MPSSNTLPSSISATPTAFNSRYPAYVIPTGPFSDATERAQSVATAVSQATASGVSVVYVPAAYTPYHASLISSFLTNSGVYLVWEGSL